MVTTKQRNMTGIQIAYQRTVKSIANMAPQRSLWLGLTKCVVLRVIQ